MIDSVYEDADYDKLIEKVLNHKLPKEENEVVLSALTIAYNLNNSPETNQFLRQTTGCSVNGRPAPCGTAGALIGLITGMIICGLGGALIGGLIGGIGSK